MAERAEAAGFDSVWIGDSLIARPRHEPLTLMAAVAARTRRVRIGTGVLLPALRNPVVLAHVVGTLDRVAEGRIILGVGIAGDMPAIRKEFAAAGVPWDRRVGRFLEILAICQALWTRDGVSFSGKHFTLDNVTMEPKPHRPGGPPIWIGGSGPTALREAARFDAWFPTGPSVEFFAEHFPRIQAAARAAGRKPDAVTGAAYVTLAFDANPAAAEQRLHSFLETYYSSPARVVMARQATYAGPIEGAAEWLQRWIDAGARHISLRFAGGDQLAQVDEAASHLLPRLKRG
jgi:probable F420-dependent oxidoreductase